MNKVLDITQKEQYEGNYIKTIKQLKFGMYKHKLITEKGTIIDQWFIALKDRKTNIVLELTPYTRLLRYSYVNIDLRRSETIEVWGEFICMFLNYVLINNYEKFKIHDIKDITIKIGNDFLQDYADGIVGNEQKTLETVKTTMQKLCKLYLYIKNIYKKRAKYIYKYNFKNVDKENKVRYDCSLFKINAEKNKEYSEQHKKIFRNMPIEIFEIFLRLSKQYYPELTFAITLQAYAGLRPSEVCNVRQVIDPQKPGMKYLKVGSKMENISIDLTRKYEMRADGKPVGGIKKRREQKVYTPYIDRVQNAYKEHLKELEKYELEKGYYPMFVNKDGKAITVKSYREKIERLANVYLREYLSKSENPSHRYYAEILTQKKLSPHFLRHYFTVLLVIDNLTPHEIAIWRGDNALDSSLIYCRDKSELLKNIKEINEDIIEEMLRGVVDD